MLGEKFKYLENGKSFKGELKIIFHHFKGFKGTSVAKSCLRPDSVPLTLFRMERRGGGRAKRPTYQCCPISTNVEIIPQNFWTFIFNPFFSLMQNLKTFLVPGPIYWTWTKGTFQKCGFSGQIFLQLRLW